MSAKKVLERARALVSKPEAWCQCALAETADDRQADNRCAPEYAGAVRWCVVGALTRAAHELGESMTGARGLFSSAIEDMSISWWNDMLRRDHADVLKAFDRALALAETEGPA